MDAIGSLITSVGFPIVCCLGLAWYVKYITDKHEKEIETISKSHEKQTNDLKKSFDKNTEVLSELVFMLKRGDKNE